MTNAMRQIRFHTARVSIAIAVTTVVWVGTACGPASITPVPSCDGVVCPGNGSCVLQAAGPACWCETGYAGPGCDACDLGYALDSAGACAEIPRCVNSDPCATTGTCHDDPMGAQCQCDPGYAGPSCDACAAGFQPSATGGCDPALVCPPSDPCGPGGTCAVSEGTLSCTCAPGFSGPLCRSCATGHVSDGEGDCIAVSSCPVVDPCGPYGVCDDRSGQVTCQCRPFVAGPGCARCAAGYHDENGWCIRDELCAEENPCVRGTCEDDTGRIHCACDAGWAGAHCDACAPDHHWDSGAQDCQPNQVCPSVNPCAHGTCNDSSGVVVCDCDPGGWEGELCDTCPPGTLDDGSGVCVVAEVCTTYMFDPVQYVYQLSIPDSTWGLDLTGDAVVDNLFAAGIDPADLAVFNAEMASTLATGDPAWLMELRGLVGLSGSQTIDVPFFSAVDYDSNPADNQSGSEDFQVYKTSFTQQGGYCTDQPQWSATGVSFTDATGTGVMPSLEAFWFPFHIPNHPIALQLQQVQFQMTVTPDAGGSRVDGMVLAGAIAQADIWSYFNQWTLFNCGCLRILYPIVNGMCQSAPASSCGPGACEDLINDCPTLIAPYQSPDVDLDGDTVPDAISVGLRLDSVSASVSGVQ